MTRLLIAVPVFRPLPHRCRKKRSFQGRQKSAYDIGGGVVIQRKHAAGRRMPGARAPNCKPRPDGQGYKKGYWLYRHVLNQNPGR
jgi:hypothetical protein